MQTGLPESASNWEVESSIGKWVTLRGSWMACLEIWIIWECWDIWVCTLSKAYPTYHVPNELFCALLGYKLELNDHLYKTICCMEPYFLLSFTVSGFIWTFLLIVGAAGEGSILTNDLWGPFWSRESDSFVNHVVSSLRNTGVLAMWAPREGEKIVNNRIQT